jgi:hypothetical protein
MARQLERIKNRPQFDTKRSITYRLHELFWTQTMDKLTGLIILCSIFALIVSVITYASQNTFVNLFGLFFNICVLLGMFKLREMIADDINRRENEFFATNV